MNEWMTLPIIDWEMIQGPAGGGGEQPTFRATTLCPFNWDWIAVAFVAGALVMYYAKK